MNPFRNRLSASSKSMTSAENFSFVAYLYIDINCSFVKPNPNSDKIKLISRFPDNFNKTLLITILSYEFRCQKIRLTNKNTTTILLTGSHIVFFNHR